MLRIAALESSEDRLPSRRLRDTRVRTGHALALLEALGERPTKGAVARAVRFGYKVLEEARHVMRSREGRQTEAVCR
jgi:hypothetical protein